MASNFADPITNPINMANLDHKDQSTLDLLVPPFNTKVQNVTPFTGSRKVIKKVIKISQMSPSMFLKLPLPL